MEYVPFLNSSGAIVMPPNARISRGYAANLPIAPYIETVRLPVVSVDSSALYGEHPENLVTLTYSSGAALTFFCDSVAGGADNSGDGSVNNPWRSMNTALRFLTCNFCVLNAAVPYVQLKVRGTVDYPGWPTRWNPAGNYVWEKLILTGWGEQADLTSAIYSAGCCFNLKLRLHEGGYAFPTCSGCSLVDEGRVRCAVNCEITNSSYYPNSADAAYNCSGKVNMISCGVLYGGSFGDVGRASARHCVCYADYAYSAVVAASKSNDSNFGLAEAFYLRSAAAGVTATMSCVGSAPAHAIGVAASSVYLRDCTASAVSVNSPGSSARAVAVSGMSATLTVVGGNYTASAVAVDSSYRADADARAVSNAYGGVSYNGVQTTLFASAKCIRAADAAFTEREAIYDFGGSCIRERGRRRNERDVLVPFSTSSGGLCS